MCSSPKSSGQHQNRTRPIKGVFASMSNSSRQRFAMIANLADERRQRLKSVNQQQSNVDKKANLETKKETARTVPKHPFTHWLRWAFKKDLLSFD